ncbi:MAG TPA: YeeE/YedE thiosulfate transporter family protein [Hyphomicrobiaceae bacterium]|nr:YeeE/YedE thiosulfate transporter family protein [Hyphomicrobiaceae bacterium]
MDPTTFTPVSSLIGGALIGVAAVLMMATTGRVAGVSGIVSRLLPPYQDGEAPSRTAFVAGLLLAPMLYTVGSGSAIAHTVASNLPLLALAGLLVGAGAVLGSGCTSGHGVCGIARRSPRSIASTLMFMATAFLTVFVMRHLVGA